MPQKAKRAHLVVVEEGLALHQLVILANALVEEVADGGVVCQHQSAHPVRARQVGGLLRERHLKKAPEW